MVIKNKKVMVENIFIGFAFVALCSISWLFGASYESNKTYKTSNIIVASADMERVILSTGLVIENKGFNVGDTLVIIKK